MRVLVIEDEALLAEQVADGLRDRGIAVDVAADGATALHKAGVNGYDVVVLDRDLPRRARRPGLPRPRRRRRRRADPDAHRRRRGRPTGSPG